MWCCTYTHVAALPQEEEPILTCLECGKNLDEDNPGNEVTTIHANTENVKEEESSATKAVKEFTNQRHIQNDEIEIPGQDLICFDVVLSVEAVEYECKEFVDDKVDRNN